MPAGRGRLHRPSRSGCPRILEEAQSGKADIEPRRREAFGDAAEATRLHEAKAAELIALQSARSLIPWKAAERRDQIAHAANVPVADLPYAAELIDIADGQERWRPAAEKVMRSFGMRLLVPEHHKKVISEYIDNHDMRGLVEYSIVTAASAHQPRPRPDTLAGKLTVDTDHPCGMWLAAQLARRFDHACVETARDLEQHRIAVTVRGTVKLPGSHYRKDDRPELTSPSSYILGANTAAKRAALETEATQLAEAKKKAVADAEDLDGRYQKLDAILDAASQIVTYTDWTLLDYRASARAGARLKERIEAIKADNVDLQQLEKQRDTAKEEWKSAAGASSGIRSKITGHRDRRDALAGTHEQEQRKPHTISDDAQRSYLDAAYSSIGVDASPETMQAFSAAFRKELEQRKSARGERPQARASEDQDGHRPVRGGLARRSAGHQRRRRPLRRGLRRPARRDRATTAPRRNDPVPANDQRGHGAVDRGAAARHRERGQQDPGPRRHGQRGTTAGGVQSRHPPADRLQGQPVRGRQGLPQASGCPAEQRTGSTAEHARHHWRSSSASVT